MEEERTEIGGMTYYTYDPEKDPSGMIGMGLAEARYQELKRSKLEQEIEDAEQRDKRKNYLGFLREAKHVRTNDFEKDYTEKKEILQKYFPRRFGKRGSQSLEFYSAMDVGVVFRNLIVFAENIVDR